MKTIRFSICIIILTFFCITFSVSHENNNSTSKDFSIFTKNPMDKYYTGWLDKRAMVSRVFLNYNFDVVDSFKTRDPNDTFDYSDAFIFFDLRLAKDFTLYRNDYFTVGGFGGMEALMFAKEKRINDISFYVYDFTGEFGPFVDIWLQKCLDVPLKIRIYPYYHQSTHFIDGYKGSFEPMGASYELFGINLYYYENIDNHSFSPYGGIETTYRYAGNGAPAFKIHIGNDYRYSFSETYDINFLFGVNLAYIYDYKDRIGLIQNQNSFASSLGAGVEFHSYILSLKYNYGRGRGATTYYTEQSSVGIDLTIMI